MHDIMISQPSVPVVPAAYMPGAEEVEAGDSCSADIGVWKRPRINIIPFQQQCAPENTSDCQAMLHCFFKNDHLKVNTNKASHDV